MDNKTWTELKSLFYEAIDLPTGERDNFINTHCNDPELKREIYALFAASDKAEEFLEAPSLSLGAGTNENIFIGKYFGRYRIEKLIARGGMGLVYLGIRDDEVKQSAAVKIINPGVASDIVIKRFQNERQTLANLNHPNISSLLDGGITDDGIQYLIMEYIEGIPCDIYCDSKKLNIRERLNLFLQVAAAVQYAHQNLVVHRDLKPGNILITANGEPKLLDFGIAKLLNNENETQLLTRIGTWNLTPEYASPEQIKGETITTASDVYSLGIILYKLLCGHNPYKIKSKDHSDINKIVTTAEPIKPSEAIYQVIEKTSGGEISKIDPQMVSNARNGSVEKISRMLSGDLDNIIAMSIRKEPERRYQSVGQFADDIKRYLNDEPVIAHKDSLAYRSRKFIKRNRASVMSALIFIILILAGIAGIVWQSRLTAKERDIANNEAEKANRIKSFLANMISAPDPKQEGGDVKVIDVIQKAAANLSAELKGQPLIEAEIRTLIGNTYQNLGIYDSAENEMNKALAINNKLFGFNSKETAIAIKNLGLVFHYKGNFEKADSLYKKSLNMLKRNESKPSFEAAKVMDLYGTLMTDMGNYEKAKEITINALSIAEKSNDKDDYEVGIIINNLATAHNYLNELDEADSLYRLALKIFRKKFGNNSILVSSILNNLAFIHIFKKEHNKALPFLEESLSIKKNILGDSHPDLILAYSNLGSTFFNDNQFEKAESITKKSVDIALQNFNEDNVNVSRAYMWYGRALEANGKAKAGIEYLRKAFEIRKKEFGSKNKLTLQTQGMFGKCLLTAGKFSEAEKNLLACYNGLNEIAGDKDESTIKTLNILIDLYNAVGKKAYAKRYSQILSREN